VLFRSIVNHLHDNNKYLYINSTTFFIQMKLYSFFYKIYYKIIKKIYLKYYYHTLFHAVLIYDIKKINMFKKYLNIFYLIEWKK
jgi:hypothetical protein